MIRSILLASDLSERSKLALGRAVMIAREHGARLLVLHVLDEELPIRMAEKSKQVAEEILKEQLDALDTAELEKVDLKVAFGHDYRTVLDWADGEHADLIVIGNHRKQLSREIFRGSTGEHIIRHGDKPILLVREEAQRPYQKAMVAVDFSPHSRHALDFALKLAPRAEFHAVHAYLRPPEVFGEKESNAYKNRARRLRQMIESEIETFVASTGDTSPAITKAVVEGEILDVVREQIETVDPDLLVLGTHGRTGLPRFFLGSVAEGFLAKPPRDVLVVGAW